MTQVIHIFKITRLLNNTTKRVICRISNKSIIIERHALSLCTARDICRVSATNQDSRLHQYPSIRELSVIGLEDIQIIIRDSFLALLTVQRPKYQSFCLNQVLKGSLSFTMRSYFERKFMEKS